MELIEQIKKDLKEILSERRYIHSLGVMEMAGKLAKIHNEDIETAKIAGLLHDIAKEMPKEEMLKYVKENNIETKKIKRNKTAIIHGKIGADIARKRYGVSKQIQNAIKYHTTTSPEMDTLAKIVYVADKTEMNRKSEDYDIEYERKLAKEDLDAVIIYIIDTNIKSLIDKNKLIEEESVKTRNSLMIKKLEN